MKRLLIPASVLFALFIAAVAVAPFIASSDIVRERVAAQLSEWTGRTVTLGGDPSISYFPYLGFTLSEVAIGPDAKAGGAPIVEMEALKGRLKFLPLLTGRVEAQEFELVRPRINLVVDGAGRPNWARGDGAVDIGAKESQEERQRRRLSTATQIAELDLAPVTVTDGTIRYEDRQAGRSAELTSVNLAVDWTNPFRPATASGSFVWNGETVQANAAATSPLSLIAGRSSPARIAVASPTIRLAFDGVAYSVSEVQLDGETTITVPSLRHLIEWTGHPMEPASTLGAASIKARANLVGRSVTFSDAKMELDGNQAVGALSVSALDGRPKIQGTLAFEKLDLSPYLENFRASTAAKGRWQEARIDLPILTEVDADLRLSATQVLFGSAKLGEAAASAVLSAGRLAITVGAAQLATGQVQATLQAQYQEGGSLVGNAQASVANVPVKTALREFFGIDALDGIATGSVQVSGSGRSWGELVRGLTGAADIRATSVSLSGLDLAKLTTVLLDRSGAAVSPNGGVAAFDTLQGKLSFAGGSVRTDTLAAESKTYAVSIDGVGSLLVPWISGRGTITVKRPEKSPPNPSSGLPFAVAGSWQQPVFGPDLDRLMRGYVHEPAPAITVGGFHNGTQGISDYQ